MVESRVRFPASRIMIRVWDKEDKRWKILNMKMDHLYKLLCEGDVEVIIDEENNTVIINGSNMVMGKLGPAVALSTKTHHHAEKIIWVYVDDEGKLRFNYMKNRDGETGEFEPDEEMRNYIFEQLIGG